MWSLTKSNVAGNPLEDITPLADPDKKPPIDHERRQDLQEYVVVGAKKQIL